MFLRALARPIVNTITKTQTRSTSAVVGVPANKVNPIEQGILAAIMISSFMAVPAWVLIHLKEYRGAEKSDED